jgi:hypothetical protein
VSDLNDKNPPYHLINAATGQHIGPFSSYLDAMFARTIGEGGWARAAVMNRAEFDGWIAGLR